MTVIYHKIISPVLKNILTICLFLLSLNSFSQRGVVRNIPQHDQKRLHFGFTLGINFMDFDIQPSDFAVANDFYPEVSQLIPGFNINIVSNLKLNKYFDLRFLPGIAFGQRNIDYFREAGYYNYQELESSFLEFPLLLKYSSVRVNNFKPYFIAGLNGRYDLAKNFNEDDEIYIRLKPIDFYFEFGGGIDFYLPYFKFSTEIKYAKGFRDVMDRVTSSQPVYQSSIDYLKSNLIIISFHFE